MKEFFLQTGRWIMFGFVFAMGTLLFAFVGSIAMALIFLGWNMLYTGVTLQVVSVEAIQIETAMAVSLAMAASIALMIWAVREQLRSELPLESVAPKSEEPESESTRSGRSTEEPS
jgi:hypothetical protein